MIDELKKLLEPYQIECSEIQLQQFQLFYRLLLDWNEKMNLTAITEEREVMVKHFFDSVTPAFYFPLNQQKIIDIGAGAGFPSIPLKICFPQIDLTLLDSLNKRIQFLKLVGEELGFTDYRCIHGRAEEIGQGIKYRESYDIGIARAVARLNILVELTLPFVKKGGNMIAMKGSNSNEELIEAKKAIQLLGAKVEHPQILELPYQYGERAIILLHKVKNTPKLYPRKPGTPSRQPIF
ncbi:16S rRNA (guanine(527)-N(7))-methyltransferase RsmG [Tepidibacillus marianensis]|uniref:16S rRNA (guanine(527)-N(7))-methyltransferase RsmG n=1 Tax=Tepidibacillus marianensis TaxID=3131995 RepID=UPI0030CCFF30